MAKRKYRAGGGGEEQWARLEHSYVLRKDLPGQYTGEKGWSKVLGETFKSSSRMWLWVRTRSRLTSGAVAKGTEMEYLMSCLLIPEGRRPEMDIAPDILLF